jgi:3-deoxy-D-manno-octulosonate 8-phosphate phosphatase (KDO 8-P phosphatase)
MGIPHVPFQRAGSNHDTGDLLRRIRFVLTDVDGTLTDSNLIYDHQGVRQRAFSTRDGAGIQWLIQSGIPVGFLSALDDPSTRLRGRDLGVEEIHLGAKDKLATLVTILERLDLKPEEVAYFGDDLVDLPVLAVVGFSACPSDAADEVRLASTAVLAQKGGEGFFRAAAELILKAQGHWDAIVNRYRIPSKPPVA